MLSSRCLHTNIALPVGSTSSQAPGAKKGVEPIPLSEPLRQGSVEQHGRRPFRGAVQRLPLHFKSPKAQVRRFRRSSWTLARRSTCIHGHAFGTAGGILPVKCRVVAYRLPVVKGRQDHAFTGWETPRRNVGPIRGAMVRKARSTDRAGDRLATGLQPGQPSR